MENGLPSVLPSPRPLRSSRATNIGPPSTPLPDIKGTSSASELKCVEFEIQSRESDFLLEVQFQELRQKISPLFSVLGKTVPASPLENAMMTKDVNFNVTPAVLAEAQILLEDLTAQVDEKGESAFAIWTEIKELWSELEKNEERQLTFSNAHIGVLEALKFLKSQYLKRKEEKQERITVFILDLRAELMEIWNQCLISEEEKQQFKSFYSDAYTEELLDIHKEELKKWKIYHEKNQEVLDKMKHRQEMWRKLRELEARSEDPNRFVNRGGALLKDQKDLATITKSLPKLENELRKLADQFENDHGRKVTVFGQDICSLMEKEWITFNEEKQQKKLGGRSKVRQSIMPPIPPRMPEKRPGAKATSTPATKRKCYN